MRKYHALPLTNKALDHRRFESSRSLPSDLPVFPGILVAFGPLGALNLLQVPAVFTPSRRSVAQLGFPEKRLLQPSGPLAQRAEVVRETSPRILHHPRHKTVSADEPGPREIEVDVVRDSLHDSMRRETRSVVASSWHR